MKKGTVLTIDDDNDLQMVMEQYLEGEGYRVLKAGDVKSAGEAKSKIRCGYTGCVRQK